MAAWGQLSPESAMTGGDAVQISLKGTARRDRVAGAPWSLAHVCPDEHSAREAKSTHE
jgi:hypothetical protein